LQLNAFRRLRQ